ncbi:hypothetical protein ACJMK2_044466 [Sinanodonta woodiana]|uniref:SHC-transforming protein 1 n=1 Tax=Sinanodonta woodiana TaxID=1069815 RepID=A0ABD3W3T3_SINWO
MASVIDKLKKKPNKQSSQSEWSRTGSFLQKPDRGWIHPDEQLVPTSGICYGVRYIGCLEVTESMRNLDFDTRTLLAREAINKVAEEAGLKSVNRRRKVDKKICKMLGDIPSMQYAGANVNLTITTECITLIIMESGELIANHGMQGISFASGGDAETLDFVGYVAKDAIHNRACHVLECGGGLAEDVITTIGQAFELRFKEYLRKQPKPVTLPDRTELTIHERDAWGDDDEYYNDKPGAQPPSPTPQIKKYHVPPEYGTPSNIPVSDGIYSSVKERQDSHQYNNAADKPLIDFSDNNVYDNREKSTPGHGFIALGGFDSQVGFYDNKGDTFSSPVNGTNGVYDNKASSFSSSINGTLDPFDMEPFNTTIPESSGPKKETVKTTSKADLSPHLHPHSCDADSYTTDAAETEAASNLSAPLVELCPYVNTEAGIDDEDPEIKAIMSGLSDDTDRKKPFGFTFSQGAASGASNGFGTLNLGHQVKVVTPVFEDWFHGPLSRKDAEKLLLNDGDFLVRQSSGDANQYVLSGRQNGSVKHLLLVDPEGVVRTKDHTFESIPHLIHFHISNNLPIISQESELRLIRPVSNKLTSC